MAGFDGYVPRPGAADCGSRAADIPEDMATSPVENAVLGKYPQGRGARARLARAWLARDAGLAPCAKLKERSVADIA